MFSTTIEDGVAYENIKDDVLKRTKNSVIGRFIETVWNEKKSIDSTDEFGTTLFYLSCKEWDFEVAEYLLDVGANPDLKPHLEGDQSNISPPAWDYMLYNPYKSKYANKTLHTEQRTSIIQKLSSKGLLTWSTLCTSVTSSEIAKNPNFHYYKRCGTQVYENLTFWFSSCLFEALASGDRDLIRPYTGISHSHVGYCSLDLFGGLCSMADLNDTCEYVVVIGLNKYGCMKIRKENLPSKEYPSSVQEPSDTLISELVLYSSHSGFENSFREYVEIIKYILLNGRKPNRDFRRKSDPIQYETITNPEEYFTQHNLTVFIRLILNRHTETAAKILEYHRLNEAEAGVKFVSRPVKKFDPLCAAAIHGDVEMMRLLIDNGARINIEKISDDQVVRDCDHPPACLPPLFCALNHLLHVLWNEALAGREIDINKQFYILKQIVDLGGDVNVHMSTSRDPPCACGHGVRAVLSIFGSKFNVKRQEFEFEFFLRSLQDGEERDEQEEQMKIDENNKKAKASDLVSNAWLAMRVDLMKYAYNRGAQFPDVENESVLEVNHCRGGRNFVKCPVHITRFLLPAQFERIFLFYIFQSGASMPYLSLVYDLHDMPSYPSRSMENYRNNCAELCKVLLLERLYCLSDADVKGLNDLESSTQDIDSKASQIIRTSLLEWLERVKESPLSLQCQCRTLIRRHLVSVGNRRSILPRIESLPLSRLLKLYLIYEGNTAEINLAMTVDEGGSRLENIEDIFEKFDELITRGCLSL